MKRENSVLLQRRLEQQRRKQIENNKTKDFKLMVTCNLMGGLANQLFQIAATISYANENGIPYHIPFHTIDDKIWKPRVDWLQNAEYKEKRKQYSVIIHQEDFTYSRPPFQSGWTKENLILDGYFQSKKFFEKFEDIVYAELKLNDIKTIRGLVTIHWRMGDYRMHPTKHPIVTLQYITEAINHFKKIGYSDFLCISDEIESCKVLSEIEDITINYQSSDEWSDLRMLASGEHQIISNSSFSLFASFVNPNKNKQVIAPSIWFGKELELDTKDLLPENYIKL